VALHSVSQFRRRTISFELRFNHAYHIWDRSGAIWLKVGGLFKKMDLQSANPGQVVFIADDRYTLNVSIDKLIFVDNLFSSGDEYQSVFTDCAGIALSLLDVPVINRVGTRINISSPRKDLEEAQRDMCAFNLLKVPGRKLFDTEPKVVSPTFRIEVNDGELGYTVQINAQTRKVELAPAPDVKDMGVEAFNKTRHEILFDVDFYTMKAVAVDTFSVAKWLERCARELNRDAEVILNLAGGANG
jgi:hypothetical protein